MKQYTYWTEEGETALKRLWLDPKITWEHMEKVFPSRTRKAILAKSITLGLPSYTSIRATGIDKEYLKQLYEVIEG